MKIALDRTLYIVMGPPGAGKSTYINAHFPAALAPNADRYTVAHMPDHQLHFGSSVRAIAEHLAFYALEQILMRGFACVFELGGATRAERASIITVARRYGYRVHGILLEVTPDTAWRRTQHDPTRPATSKPKWRAMIDHWYERFEPIASNEFETWETITNE